jgi:hypothetical protein
LKDYIKLYLNEENVEVAEHTISVIREYGERINVMSYLGGRKYCIFAQKKGNEEMQNNIKR